MSTLYLNARVLRGDRLIGLEAELPLKGITVLFGPNGSGKTTSLRLISGLERDSEGSIRFDGQIWLDSSAGVFVPAHKRPVAMVFQDSRLFRHLTVRGNLEFARKRANADGPQIDVHQVITQFDLAEFMDRWPDTLSGGERQRTAIARALLSRPRLLLMDEPLSSLDIVRRADVLSYIEQIPEQFGVPVIYVTHSIDELARLADQLVLIRGGEILATGNVQDMLARLDLPPLTGRFEAGVVVQGVITETSAAYDLTLIDIGGATLLVPKLGLPPGEAVRLRIRARDVALATHHPEGLSIRNVVYCEVAEVVRESDTAFAEVRLRVGEQDLRARITRAAADDLKLQPGLPVYALIKSVTLDRRLLSAPRGGQRQ